MTSFAHLGTGLQALRQLEALSCCYWARRLLHTPGWILIIRNHRADTRNIAATLNRGDAGEAEPSVTSCKYPQRTSTGELPSRTLTALNSCTYPDAS